MVKANLVEAVVSIGAAGTIGYVLGRLRESIRRDDALGRLHALLDRSEQLRKARNGHETRRAA